MKKTAFLSFVAALGGILFGYDTAVISGTIAAVGGTFCFFAAMCVPYMLIMWRLVPETTGKSLEEIEAYWK